MVGDLLSRIWNFASRRRVPDSVSPENILPSAIIDLLQHDGHATALRLTLRDLLVKGQSFPIPDLLNTASRLGWSDNEVQKLAAYAEFFSGQAALAYRRLIETGLARRDYPLFMTACVQCYLHDRLAEGYTLLQMFEPDAADELDLGEFLAYAGYIAFAGGGTAAEACGYFDRALDLGLISPLLLVNAYPIYVESGQHVREEQVRQLIHHHYPEDPEAVYAVATVELSRDYYPEGFRLAEVRYRMPEAPRSLNPTLLHRPRWQGEPLSGKRLLVHGEQGLGDIVMMSRYLPMLNDLGGQILLDCRAEAAPLLRHNFPDCAIIETDLRTPIQIPFDFWTGIMSLPFHFSTRAGEVPATQGYLSTPPEQKGYWRHRVREISPGSGPKIGLAWSGNPSHRADLRRSIPFHKIVDSLVSLPAMDFFALQTRVPAGGPAHLIDLSDELITLADTAALIDEMDLVITVDTSIVHLAGALGKMTWLLLPSRYEWRWGLSGEGNNWYDSVRVLRQRISGDWDDLLAEVFGERLPLFVESLGR